MTDNEKAALQDEMGRAFYADVLRLEAEVKKLRAANDHLTACLASLANSRDAARAEAAHAEGLLRGAWDDAGVAREERDAARAEAATLRACLEWLNRRGGLGLDVHDRIDAALG